MMSINYSNYLHSFALFVGLLTSSTTASPWLSDGEYIYCFDYPTYTFETDYVGTKDCSWIDTAIKRERYCMREEFVIVEGDMAFDTNVRHICRKECFKEHEECDEFFHVDDVDDRFISIDTFPPTPSPSSHPSESPTVIDEFCYDYPGYTFETDYVGTKDCSWIDTAIKRERYCMREELVVVEGDMVFDTTIGKICYEECFKEDECVSFTTVDDTDTILPCPSTVCTRTPNTMYFEFTADSCSNSSNLQAASDYTCNDFGADMTNEGYYIEVYSSVFNPFGVLYRGFVQVGQIVKIRCNECYLLVDPHIDVYTSSSYHANFLTQSVKVDTSCDNNLANGDTFGSMKLVGYESTFQDIKCEGIEYPIV